MITETKRRPGLMAGMLTTVWSVALSGCALNDIRVDRAATMAEAGRAATQASGTFMKAAQDSWRETIVEVVAYDPACALPSPQIQNGGKRSPQVKLCPITAGASSAPLTAVSHRELLPSLATLDAIAGYLDAVDAIVRREPADLAGSLANARSDVEAVLGLVAPGTGLPAFDETQTKALNDALTLIATLALKADQVHDLRRLELAPDALQFDETIASLKAANDHWGNVLGAASLTQAAVLSAAYRRSPPAAMDDRRIAVRRQLELYELKERAPELAGRLNQLAEAFRTAHADYLALLPGGSKAKLSSKEKRKIADLTKQRVRVALHSAVTLISMI